MKIGIDLGGTNIAVGVVDESGHLIEKLSMPTRVSEGYEAILMDMVEASEALLNKHSKLHQNIESIGIGVPGVCTPDCREVYDCKNLFWGRKPLATDFENQLKIKGYTGVPVKVDNDANVAAWAEYVTGALKNVSSGVLVTLGTGVGGGIVVNGHPLRGAHGLGSEIGHMYLGENFYRCNCGKMGCFETFSSATALIKHFEWRYESVHGRKLENVNAKYVIDLAKAGDELALKTFDRFIHHLAQGIMNIVLLIDPEVIAIGGGVSHAGEFLYNRLDWAMEELAFIKGFPVASIVPAALGNDAGIIGAALLE